MKFGIGQPIRRHEDLRLITGQGRYTDDVTLPGMAQAFVLRSPVAHAHIKRIDAAAARRMPGVLFVATASPFSRAAVVAGYAPPTLVGKIFFLGGIANIVLGVFNCIPCPPLDGAAVLERLLPARVLPQYYNLQPFLMFLPFILILLFHNEWSQLIGHVINWWSGLLV